MTKFHIEVATEFTDAPGARDRTDGAFSGEEFFEDLLESRFDEALKAKQPLSINLDNTWGYASSFISGSFGRLADKFGGKTVLSNLRLVSKDDPSLIGKIEAEVAKSENKK